MDTRATHASAWFKTFSDKYTLCALQVLGKLLQWVPGIDLAGSTPLPSAGW